MESRARVTAVVAVFVLASCSGGTSSQPAAPSIIAAPSAGVMNVRIAIPAAASATAGVSRRTPAYVSASIAGVLAQVYASPHATSSTPLVTSATDVSPGSVACGGASGARTCTISIEAPSGSIDVVLSAYDAPPIAGTSTFPSTAAMLSTGALLAQTVQTNAANQFTIALGGAIAHITAATSQVAPASAMTYTVPIPALDADGNSIVAGTTDPYVNPITVAASEHGGSGFTFVSLDGGATRAVSVSVTQSAQQVTAVYIGGAPAGYAANLAASAAGVAAVNVLTIAPPPPSGTITEYSVGTHPLEIVAGAGGKLWFDELSNSIASISTAGAVTQYAIPTAGSNPDGGVALGPDGNIWFAEYDGNKIAFVTTGGAFTEYPIPTASSQPRGITAGPDGNMWFTEERTNKIGKVTTSGAFTEYTVPTSASQPLGIAPGPSGTLWFTEFNTNKIGKITTSGAFTEYPIPTASSQPAGIVTGSDGALWFAEGNKAKIGRITTAGAFTEYATPAAASAPYAIAAGPDGNLWFGEAGVNKIGRLTTAGVFTEYPTPSGSSLPYGITAGPDGNVWFTEYGVNKIGKIVP